MCKMLNINYKTCAQVSYKIYQKIIIADVVIIKISSLKNVY